MEIDIKYSEIMMEIFPHYILLIGLRGLDDVAEMYVARNLDMRAIGHVPNFKPKGSIDYDGPVKYWAPSGMTEFPQDNWPARLAARQGHFNCLKLITLGTFPNFIEDSDEYSDEIREFLFEVRKIDQERQVSINT